MAEKKTHWHELTKGFVSENPVLRLVLGTCPTLAISTSVTGSLGMGLSATLVLSRRLVRRLDKKMISTPARMHKLVMEKNFTRWRVFIISLLMIQLPYLSFWSSDGASV